MRNTDQFLADSQDLIDEWDGYSPDAARWRPSAAEGKEHALTPEQVQSLHAAAGVWLESLGGTMRRLMEELRAAFERVAVALRPLTAISLRYQRAQIGGNATDAARYPDQWMSVWCAGLLCATNGPCSHTNLKCTCSCHHTEDQS